MLSKEYLSFTKRERTGIVILVILLIIMAVMPKFFCNPEPVAEKLPDKQLQRLFDQKPNYYSERKYKKTDSVYVGEYVPYKYPRKSYRREPSSPHPWRDGRTGGESRKKFPAARPVWVRPRLQPIDINIADTSDFIALPGIGSKLANRIVSFRIKLGGFNSVEQIRKVYGLQDSVFLLISPLLKCDNPDVVTAQQKP